MKARNLILAGVNLAALGAGAFLLVQSGHSSKAQQSPPTVAPGSYDIVGSADMNNDGQIDATDLNHVKSCISSLDAPISAPCRGAWQRLTEAHPGDGVVKYQKVGLADINGDGHVTIGDLVFVKTCLGRLQPDACYGQLARRIVITGHILDAQGRRLGGVDVFAQGTDAQGDPYP